VSHTTFGRRKRPNTPAVRQISTIPSRCPSATLSHSSSSEPSNSSTPCRPGSPIPQACSPSRGCPDPPPAPDGLLPPSRGETMPSVWRRCIAEPLSDPRANQIRPPQPFCHGRAAPFRQTRHSDRNGGVTERAARQRRWCHRADPEPDTRCAGAVKQCGAALGNIPWKPALRPFGCSLLGLRFSLCASALAFSEEEIQPRPRAAAPDSKAYWASHTQSCSVLTAP
jgi:hypothetical protein